MARPGKAPATAIPVRPHYARKNIGATVGAGGRAKTTFGLLEFVGMACGRNLLTGEEIAPLRGWYVNGEEDQDELDRRVAAICQHYTITKVDCGGRLFVQSVRDKPIRFATLNKTAPVLNRDVLGQFEAEIRQNRIDVFGLDPWVSFHALIENDNGHMDLVLKEGLGAVASRTNSAGEVFHHPSKPKPGQADTTVEDARGASAIIFAVRSARVLNFMTPEEAIKLGIVEDDRRLHVRVSNGKANMGPLGKATWFKLTVENLPNGDEIACASPWKPPDPFQGISTADMHKCRTLAQTGAYRLDNRSADWIGYAIAEVLNIKVAHGADNNRKDLARIKQIVKTWIKNGVLTIEKRKDSGRKERTFVVPGPWTDVETEPDPEEITLQ
jgi:AAA domain